MPRKKLEGVCSVDGCESPLDSRGLCTEHYYRQWKFGRLHKVNTGKKRSHPLYILWHDRKVGGQLVPEWLDFWAFVEGVGEKPGPNFVLVRLRDEPFGPTNFKWFEHLRRGAEETNKEWWARKRAARLFNFPSMDRERDMRRKYGITIAQYQAILETQGGKCAICKMEETAFDPRTGAQKRLAVDHCHNSEKIRGLLCWDCNTGLGKAKESVEILKAMIAYLEKHA